jgi:hypothetical protein
VPRKPFLLRLDPSTLAALQKWAADDLRSLNAQIEFLLRQALRDAHRLSAERNDPPPTGGGSSSHVR